MSERTPTRKATRSPRKRAAPAAAPVALRNGNRAFQWALLASLVIHAVILSIHFDFPKPAPMKEKDRGLEVVLVNARHARTPDKPAALAQANLDGGGTSEKDARPKSPLPAKDAQRDGDALIDARKRAPAPEIPRQKVLTQAKADVRVASAAPKAEQTEAETPTRGLDLLDSAAAVARMEAEISRSLDEYAKRPRKKFIGARTREYRFAQYVEDWRQKIERVGTLNYPDAARGRMYGSLLLSVVIRADGSIDKVEVQRSSGEKVLDAAAISIVQLAAPFAPFPQDIRVDTDILEITRTWTFTNTDKVTAN